MQIMIRILDRRKLVKANLTCDGCYIDATEACECALSSGRKNAQGRGKEGISFDVT